MKEFLDRIRKPKMILPLWAKVAVSAGFFTIGVLIGALQKRLDSIPVNELPAFCACLDIGNFFGRLGIWVLIGTVISVYSHTPLRAALNVFLFFMGMLAGYYAYCKFALGFFPASYAAVWMAIALVSPFLAFICWYAKGSGAAAVIISGIILGVLFSQAILLLQGIRITHLTEVFVLAAGLIVLLRRPKELLPMLGVMLGTALLYQLIIPYWG